MLQRASTRPRTRATLTITILAAAALYLLGNGTVGLWDRDEPRYAQCARQMLKGFPGPNAHPPGFLVPHFLNDLRTEKPPLIYWLQATAMRVFGDNAFAARFPSAMAMVGVLILLAIALDRAIGPMRAGWTVFVMATSALTIMSAKMCLTDATLLLWTTSAQICAFAVYRGKRQWWVTAIFWIALGLGGLTKGPIVLATIGSTLLALAVFDRFIERRWNIRWWLALRPITGLLILAVIDGPWLYLVNKREPTFLPRLFGAAKHHLSGAAEQHSGPPGFYLGLLCGLFFPWSLLLPTTLTIAWKQRQIPVVRYALAMFLGIWIFQEIMPTKLPFYILPTFPALALLTADALVRCQKREHDDLLRPVFRVVVVLFAMIVIGLGLAPWLLTGTWPKQLFHVGLDLSPLVPRFATAVLSALAIVFALSVARCFFIRRLQSAALAMGIGTMLLFAVLFGLYLPRADFIRLPMRLAKLLPANPPPGQAILLDYKEPSLAFYQGGTMIEEPHSRFLETTPPEQWPAWIVLPRSRWEALPPSIRDQFQIVGHPQAGINYAGKIGGKQVIEVMVVQKK